MIFLRIVGFHVEMTQVAKGSDHLALLRTEHMIKKQCSVNFLKKLWSPGISIHHVTVKPISSMNLDVFLGYPLYL